MDLRAETGSSIADRHDCLEVAGTTRSRQGLLAAAASCDRAKGSDFVKIAAMHRNDPDASGILQAGLREAPCSKER
jgi:hypothetical protein